MKNKNKKNYTEVKEMIERPESVECVCVRVCVCACVCMFVCWIEKERKIVCTCVLHGRKYVSILLQWAMFM